MPIKISCKQGHSWSFNQNQTAQLIFFRGKQCTAWLHLGLWASSKLSLLFFLEKAPGRPYSSLQWLERRLYWGGSWLLLPGISYSTRENGFKLQQGRLRLDIRKHFFSVRMIMQWNSLPREVVELPSMEVLQKCIEVALRILVTWWWWVDGWSRSEWTFPALVILSFKKYLILEAAWLIEWSTTFTTGLRLWRNQRRPQSTSQHS